MILPAGGAIGSTATVGDDAAQAPLQSVNLPTFVGGLWLDVKVPQGVDPIPAEVQFYGPCGKMWRAWVPPGAIAGQSFKVQLVGDVALQAHLIVVPHGMKTGDDILFTDPEKVQRIIKVPVGVNAEQTFATWTRSLPIPPPAKQEEISASELAPWLAAAEGFDMNLDFQVPDLEKETTTLTFEALMTKMKDASESKPTIQALSDKILLSRMLDNLGVPQMPTYLCIETLDELEEKIEAFVNECSESEDPHDLFVKPSHLSSGLGICSLPLPGTDGDKEFKGFKPVGEKECESVTSFLKTHMAKFMAEKANETESAALRSLRPGYLVQPKYKSVVGFHYPLELRIIVVWGRARLGIWWWGHNRGKEEDAAQRNTWFARRQQTVGEIGKEDAWEAVHHHAGANPGFDAALTIFQKHITSTAASAEHIAVAYGAPFLRVDFFVGSPDWAVRLNEVAYGSSIDMRRPSSNGDGELVDDAIVVAQILQEGMERCKTRSAPEQFLSRVGVQGKSYEEMIVKPLERAKRIPQPEGTLVVSRDTDCESHRVPAELCKTPRDIDSASVSWQTPQGHEPPPPSQLSIRLLSQSAKQLVELEPEKATQVVVAFFRNVMPKTVELNWRDPDDGDLVPQGTLDPGDEVEVHTAHSHTFVFRSGVELVKQWQCNIEDGLHQEVEVNDKIAVTFVNKLPSPLKLFWKDPRSGDLHPQGQLGGGKPQHARILTYHRHCFVLRSVDAHVTAEWQADAELGDSQVVSLVAETNTAF